MIMIYRIRETPVTFMSTMMVKLTICFDQTVNKLELQIQLHRKIPQFLHFKWFFPCTERYVTYIRLLVHESGHYRSCFENY